MLTGVRRNFMKNMQGDTLSCKLTPNYKTIANGRYPDQETTKKI